MVRGINILHPFSLPVNIQGKHIVNQNLYGYVKKYIGKTRKREKLNAITKKMSGDISYMNKRILIGIGAKGV